MKKRAPGLAEILHTKIENMEPREIAFSVLPSLGPANILFTLSQISYSHYNQNMKFYGELLVFVLLFITNLRVFVVHHVRRDPLVVLAPFTFVVAILQVYAWGIDVFTALGLIIALFVLLSNFHAIFRYMERLYVDHYSALMKIWAAFTIIISAAALGASIYFAPITKNSRKIGIKENQLFYKGNFLSGFEEVTPFSTKSLTIYEFLPEAENTQKYQNFVVLFAPDKRADTEHYKPFLQQLASNGVTVYSADFFTDDKLWLHSICDKKFLRRIAMVVQSFVNNTKFLSQKEYYSFNITKEYEVLVPILKARNGDSKKIYLITDFMADIAADDLMKKNPQDIIGIQKLSSIGEYKTSGYGCIEQTDPFLAMLFGLQRDFSFSTPKILAEKTLEALNDIK